MVVTRRAPAAPPSRTPSTQAAPRAASARGQNASKQNGVDLNGDVDDTSPKKFRREKPKAKKGKGKNKKSRSLTDVLSKWLLLFFTIYSLSVCPKDDKLQSPICRGLDTYRRLVLEVYVVPAFHAALENPSVAPYVEKARPYTDKAVALAKNADHRFHTQVVPAFNAHVVPVWNDRVVPLWDAHVVPAWDAHVVPQYEQHLAPHINKAQAVVTPYMLTAEQKYAAAHKTYSSHVDPYVRQAGAALHKAQKVASPYAAAAAQKGYEGYLRARPYAGPAWIKFKQLLLDVLAILRSQRRRYVDPHVAQIWNRVVELSQGTPGPAASKSEPKTTAAKPAPPAEAVVKPAVMEAEDLAPEPAVPEAPVDATTATSSSTATSTSTPAPAVIEVEEIEQPVLSSAVKAATETASTLSSTAATLSSSAVQSVSTLASVVSQSASSVSSVVAESTPSASAVVEPFVGKIEKVVEPVIERAEEIVEPIVEQVKEAAEPVVNKAEEIVEPVVEKVTSATKAASSSAPLASVTSATSQASASSAAISQAVLSAAAAASESASSVAAAATSGAKRVTKSAEDLDLESLYAELGLEDDDTPEVTEEAQPEETLTPEQIAERDAQFKAHVAAKRAAIQARHSVWEEQIDALVAQKQESVRKSLVAGRKAAVAEFKSDEGIKGSVDGLVEEAERFLAGAEAYMKNLKKEGKTNEEKSVVWDKVLDKIDGKFSKRLEETEGTVNAWFDAHNAREEQEVHEQASEIKSLAETAQSDIGLDYVWLEDVTYNDWQRYHDLIRRYENFVQDALTVQNGSHDSPVVNPVETALVDLEAEVKDIVTGFETRLRQLRRSGARTFTAATEDEEKVEEVEEVLNEAEEKLLKEPDVVEILPIPKEEGHPEAIRAPDVPVVGRGKEEVEQAFARAAAAEEAMVADAAADAAAAPAHEEL